MALDLPDEARAALVEWREQALEGRRDLRPVAVEALHVTLVFLGYLPEKEIERTAAVTFGALEGVGAPLMAMREVRPVPPRNPRLFAVDLADEADRVTTIQEAAVRALADARLHSPEKRPFWPHVTVARVKRGERRVPPLDAPAPPAEPFRARVVTLYRSHLSPRGARYEALRRLSLGG
ncbi:MAG TPA: RNA 2',3'-cyclic phosphodiesterase [Thermoleophilaceae bacterium]|nr:RNA 2',3'-cyclic phosphodiesterase [Thermoleophilaceae bacterium]